MQNPQIVSDSWEDILRQAGELAGRVLAMKRQADGQTQAAPPDSTFCPKGYIARHVEVPLSGVHVGGPKPTQVQVECIPVGGDQSQSAAGDFLSQNWPLILIVFGALVVLSLLGGRR